MSANKFTDPLLGLGVKILEFVQGSKLFHIQPVGSDNVGLAFQQMLSFEASDVRYRGEHVSQVGTSSLDAVAVVNLAFAGFFVNVELV